MRATRVDGAEGFLARAGPFLCAREAEHNLALGLLGRLRVDPRLYAFDPTFVVAEDAGLVVGCLLRTPPDGVVLSRFESLEAVDAIAETDPDGAWLLWDDGGPVSLAAYGSPTPIGTRVGPMYTPPELRGRGYATSVVVELTEERLATGLAFCFRCADLANPTSTAIYVSIGYEPVADQNQWSFV